MGGATIWEDHFYPEIVDPQSGAPLPDGELGELVFTSLAKQAMPVIRYRTRDLTRLLPGVGGAMRRMAKIVGRSDDMLIVRGVNLFPTQIEEQILRCPELAPHFELEIRRPGRLDELLVRVETRLADCAAEPAERLARYVKEAAGVSIRVALAPPGALARSAGKAQRVRDLRG
jgi:phenylacetate-CoA ligase